MKTVTVEVKDLVYLFYEKVARQAGVPVEEIVSNALFRMAGELSMRLGKGEIRWGRKMRSDRARERSASAKKRRKRKGNPLTFPKSAGILLKPH